MPGDRTLSFARTNAADLATYGDDASLRAVDVLNAFERIVTAAQSEPVLLYSLNPRRGTPCACGNMSMTPADLRRLDGFIRNVFATLPADPSVLMSLALFPDVCTRSVLNRVACVAIAFVGAAIVLEVISVYVAADVLTTAVAFAAVTAARAHTPPVPNWVLHPINELNAELTAALTVNPEGVEDRGGSDLDTIHIRGAGIFGMTACSSCAIRAPADLCNDPRYPTALPTDGCCVPAGSGFGCTVPGPIFNTCVHESGKGMPLPACEPGVCSNGYGTMCDASCC